jgi:hypothetical protein
MTRVGPETHGDLADWRIVLLHERDIARRELLLGAMLLASTVPMVLMAVLTNDIVLFVATFYAPLAIGFGLKFAFGGIRNYSRASLKLRQLHARDNGLPRARLIE